MLTRTRRAKQRLVAAQQHPRCLLLALQKVGRQITRTLLESHDGSPPARWEDVGVSWPLSFGRVASRPQAAAVFLPLLPMSQRVGNTTLAFARVWHHVDARERVLGGLARSIAVTLMGKNKPVYDPSRDVGDYVVVTNAEHITVTGQKADKKLYRHHTMYPGGLKEIPFKTMMQTKPEQILRRAVSGMLPKNKLRDRRLERLKIYPNDAHPYEANIIKRY